MLGLESGMCKPSGYQSVGNEVSCVSHLDTLNGLSYMKHFVLKCHINIPSRNWRTDHLVVVIIALTWQIGLLVNVHTFAKMFYCLM